MPLLFAGPGWLPAGELRGGDHLRTASGHDVVVVGLRYHVGQELVYILTVAKEHTFFVGAARVLVHNTNPCYTHDELVAALTVVSDRAGKIYRLVGISSHDSRFPKQLLAQLQPTDIAVRLPGHRHAEINLIQETEARNWKLVAVAPTNNYCASGACYNAIKAVGAFPGRRNR